MPGLLQTYDISSDTDELLQHALALPFGWNKKGATHYVTGKVNGSDSIELRWAEGSSGEKAILLPYALNTPEKMFTFVRDWLSGTVRGPQPDTDGHNNRGWRVTQGSFYAVCKVQADWITYGK